MTAFGSLSLDTDRTLPIDALPLRIFTFTLSPYAYQIHEAYAGSLVLLGLVIPGFASDSLGTALDLARSALTRPQERSLLLQLMPGTLHAPRTFVGDAELRCDLAQGDPLLQEGQHMGPLGERDMEAGKAGGIAPAVPGRCRCSLVFRSLTAAGLNVLMEPG